MDNELFSNSDSSINGQGPLGLVGTAAPGPSYDT